MVRFVSTGENHATRSVVMSRLLEWDPVRERFVNDDANKLLSRPLCDPWKL